MAKNSGHRLLALVLGASRFEDDPDENGVAPRLRASAAEIDTYVREPNGLGLHDDEVFFLHDKTEIKNVRLDNAGTCQVIEEWIAERRNTIPDQQFDVLIFFVGHGLPPAGGSAKLALRVTQKANPYLHALDPDQLSRALVGSSPRGSRFFLFLDCCFARDVKSAMTFYARDYRQGVNDLGPRTQANGVLALCASDNNTKAFAPPEDRFTRLATMFFEALKEPSAARNSYRDIYDKMLAYKEMRRSNSRGTWADLPPMPYLDVVKQTEGDTSIDTVPVLRSGWRQAIEPFCYPTSDIPSNFTAVVVCREQGSSRLLDVVERALIFAQSGHRLENLTGKHIASELHRIEQHVFKLDVGTAFIDRAAMHERIRAVCNADLAVFDTTGDGAAGIEPGGMFLLGVRAVAARGVTVCSVDRQPEELFSTPLPYNLQHLNISTHQPDDAAEQLAAKIANGYHELRRDPTYLDLPAFDAIRNLGGEVNDYTPIPYYRGPLYLGPFEKTFTSTCFRPVEEQLRVLLDGIARQEDGRDYKKPRVHRLLDDDRTRIVSQSLYHSIRRHDFCLIDWTHLKPNVFFELGVRLASRSSGDIHIVADLGHMAKGAAEPNRLNLRWPILKGSNIPEHEERAPDLTQLSHVRFLYQLFGPIVYNPQDTRDVRNKCSTIIENWQSSRSIKRRDHVVYDVVAAAMHPGHQSAVTGIANLLMKCASTEYLHDEDTLRVTLLHEDRNPALQAAQLARSIGLRLAALFLILPSLTTSQQRQALAPDIKEIGQRVRELSRRGGYEQDVRLLTESLNLIREAYDP